MLDPMTEHLLSESEYHPVQVVPYQGRLFVVVDVEPLDRTRFAYCYTLRPLFGDNNFVYIDEETLKRDICK